MVQWEATAVARKMSMRGLSCSPVWSEKQTSQPTDTSVSVDPWLCPVEEAAPVLGPAKVKQGREQLTFQIRATELWVPPLVSRFQHFN